MSKNISVNDDSYDLSRQLQYWYSWSPTKYYINDRGIMNEDDECIDGSPKNEDFIDDLFARKNFYKYV